MSEVLEIKYPETHLPPEIIGEEEILYPESHEDDMGESSIHYQLISYFFDAVKFFLKDQKDVFIAANMNLYYREKNPNKYYTPDIMVAFGVSGHNRKVYKLWEEEVCPQVIFEVSSDTTWKKDISDKVEDYGLLGVDEYYLLDPENLYLPLPLMAYRRDETGRLRLLLTNDNRVLSPLLKLEIVWENRKFRLFDPENQEFLLTTEEAKTKADKLQSENERLKAELDRLKAELKNRN